MKTLSNADARQLERIYTHFDEIADKSNDRTNNCVRKLKLIIKNLSKQ